MKIKTIEICNWGRYQKVIIPVDVSKEKNLILIRARNNVGKTTLFYSIKYAFYGKKGLSSHKQNEPNKWINRQAASGGDGKMYVELTIEHNGNEYRLQRSQKFRQTNTGDEIKLDGMEELHIFNQDNGKPEKDAGKENETKQNWINSMLIPSDVSQFFFFDGEDIKRYTDAPEESVRNAILRVLGIKTLLNAKEDLRVAQDWFNQIYTKKLTEQSKDENAKRTLQKLNDDIIEHENAVKYCTGSLNHVQQIKDDYTDKLKKYEAVKGKITERQRIEENNSGLRKSEHDNNTQLKNLRGISSLLLLDPLLKMIDKTEENPPSKDQWESKTIKHMLDKRYDQCLCGTHIDDEIKSKLEEKIIELSPNPQSDLKRYVESTLSKNMPDRKSAELNYVIKESLRIKGEIDTNDTVIKTINKELPNLDADEHISVLAQKEKESDELRIRWRNDLE